MDNDYLKWEVKASEVSRIWNNELVQNPETYFRNIFVTFKHAFLDLEIKTIEIEKVEMQRLGKKQKIKWKNEICL